MHAEKCPVCEGRMIVPGGFYNSTSREGWTSSCAAEPCRNCQGGIVFVPDDKENEFVITEGNLEGVIKRNGNLVLQV